MTQFNSISSTEVPVHLTAEGGAYSGARVGEQWATAPEGSDLEEPASWLPSPKESEKHGDLSGHWNFSIQECPAGKVCTIQSGAGA